jgi:glycosyltransferase involved in cell wall biosynthesis
MYTAQNIDKRYPPPYAQYERSAHRRVAALYPCSRQAAAVARGKGFGGLIQVLPLGYDDKLIRPGEQSPADDEIVLGLFGRLVPEKGVLDSVDVLARLNTVRPCRLVLAGEGPEVGKARQLALARGVADRVEFLTRRSPEQLAKLYATTHVVLVPSRRTETWVEQFGRVIVEGQAAGAIVAGYASGSIPEVVGEAGVLVATGDTDALARRIAATLDDRDDFERRRSAGLMAVAHCTWSSVAAMQAGLYRRVVAGEYEEVSLPRSPSARRAAASREFGPTASTAAGRRPFALPVLRRGGVMAAAFAAVSDAAGELSALAFTGGTSASRLRWCDARRR